MPITPESDPTRLIQELLDLISDTPGAILYRDHDIWRAVLPGNIGDQLTLDDQLMPVWLPPT